jgi:gas vesicle protein
MTASTSGPADAPREELRAVSQEVGETLKRQGQQIREDAKDEVQRFAAQRKHEAAAFLKDVSNALSEVTSKLDQQGHDRIARYAGVAADKLRQVGGDLPQRDLGELLRQAEKFARERPAVFLGALFIAGFGAARFLKASGEADAESGLSTGTSSGDPEQQERSNAV